MLLSRTAHQNLRIERAYLTVVDNHIHQNENTEAKSVSFAFIFTKRSDTFSEMEQSLCKGTFEIVSKEIPCSVRGLTKQYDVPLSRMLYDIPKDDDIQ